MFYFFVSCVPEDVCVLVVSVKSLLPTAVPKRPYMNNLEVLEKLPWLPRVHAVEIYLFIIAIYSQIILFTIYSDVFMWCNCRLLIFSFQIPQWRIHTGLPRALKSMPNLFQENNLSPVSLLLRLGLCGDGKFSNLSEVLWRYLRIYFFPIQSSSI